MIFPIQNINLKHTIYPNSIKAGAKKTVQNNPFEFPKSLSLINFTSNISSFSETIKDNYFQLPKIQFKDGSYYQLPPDECQLECAKNLYLGSNVVFCAPTGTGKTAVAHYIMTKNLKENKKTIYTTPLKALANDKLREFRKIYGENNVGLLTGDIKLNTTAPILIMTTEIYKNQAQSGTRDIATVVFDEAHYLGDEDRGNVWENAIINTPQDVQILCLSATIGNSDDFSNWIKSLNSTKLLSHIELAPIERHVPLVWYLYEKNKAWDKLSLISDGSVDFGKIDLNNLTNRQKRALEVIYKSQNNIDEYYELTCDEYEKTAQDLLNKLSLVQNPIKIQNFENILKNIYPSLSSDETRQIAQLLSDEDLKEINKIHTKHQDDDYTSLIQKLNKQNMLPALIFKLSKKSCSDIAESLMADGLDLTSDDEKKQINSIIEQYKKDNIYLGNNFNKDMLLSGYAYHHAGELPQYRKLIEDLFSKKLLKVVIATSTLSAGINMPAKTVVLTDMAIKKYNPKTGEFEYNLLDASSFHQMAGRAGRRGIDNLGNVVFYNLRTPDEGFKDDVAKMLDEDKEGRRLKEKSFFEKPDELQVAYELLNSPANNLRSQFKPDWCSLSSYFEENSTNDEIKNLINSSFKMYLSKNPQKEEKTLLNRFINYENVLLKQGFLEKDIKGNYKITPKGRILKMCQGTNPLLLANLIYDEKFKDIMLEYFCQLTAYVASCDERIEEDNQKDIIKDNLRRILSSYNFKNSDMENTYNETYAILQDCEQSVLRSLRESKIPINDINFSDSFSGYCAFLFAFLNMTNPDTIANFRKITGSIPYKAIPSTSDDFKDFNLKAQEGNVYKILAQTVSTIKEIQRICDFALSNPELYPNTSYYEELKENATVALELMNKNPLNDELSV